MIRQWTQPAETVHAVEEVTDPDLIARVADVHERGRRNDEWLQANWHTVVPQARGKFLAVANQQAFIADTPAEAWAWCRQTHPDDTGAHVQYVYPTTGSRIYAHRWVLAGV